MKHCEVYSREASMRSMKMGIGMRDKRMGN